MPDIVPVTQRGINSVIKLVTKVKTIRVVIVVSLCPSQHG